MGRVRNDRRDLGGGGERQEGRATTLVLGVVAAFSVAGLAFAVVQTMSDETSSAGSAEPEPSREAAAAARTSAATPDAPRADDHRAAESAGAPETERAAPKTSTQSRRMARIDAALEKLEAKRSERRGTPGGAIQSRARTNGRANDRAQPPAASRAWASAPGNADLDTAPTGPTGTPFTPGRVQITGLSPRSPAYKAGLQRGDAIVEYNGQPVRGRLELESAWADPGLPPTVEIVVEKRGSGRIEVVQLPSGNLDVQLPPRYNP